MIRKGVKKQVIDIQVLNSTFGENNIKRLLRGSYLVKVGKGVTIGI